MPPATFDSILPPHAICSDALLFGGTFDPAHKGHTQLAFAARDLVHPQGWLVFVPAAISPHKAATPTPGRHRVEMLRLACVGRQRWWVWKEELNRAERSENPSYWADTLEAARKNIPAAEPARLSFLIGADQALAFNRWDRWQRILELAQPLVLARDALRTSDQLEQSMRVSGWGPQDASLFLQRARVLEIDTVDANATDIRKQLASGFGSTINQIDPAVQRYAQRLRLYTETRPG